MLVTVGTYTVRCHFIYTKISLAIFTRIIRRRRVIRWLIHVRQIMSSCENGTVSTKIQIYT